MGQHDRLPSPVLGGGMKLQAFRVGDVIPEGARYIRSEQRKTGYTYEKVVEPRTLLAWLGITETVATMVRVETVDIYEVPEPTEEGRIVCGQQTCAQCGMSFLRLDGKCPKCAPPATDLFGNPMPERPASETEGAA